jgi:drug/metabolite transporter (DMT)-like permease
VATYAYVNPVVLGAILLGERLELSEYIGMLAVVLAVFLVTSSQVGKTAASTQQEAIAVESDS